MLKHGDIWSAIDALARDHGLTASALARKAGLDPTTFNKSKRITRDGKPRWPSTESVSKVLEATGASFGQFVTYIDGGKPGKPPATLPLISLTQAGERAAFDGNGRPVGEEWDEIPFPSLLDPHAYAVEICGAALEPLFRDGDIIVVSPTANVRRGDRVVVRTTGGEMMVGQLLRQTARRLDFAALDATRPGRSLATEEVAWLARILWASQ